MGPLSGWRVRHPLLPVAPVAEAVALLGALGARAEPSGSAGRPQPDVLTVLPPPRLGWPATWARLTGPVPALAGLPGAVPDRAAGALLAMTVLAAAREGGEVTVDPVDVAVTLLLPAVLAVSYDAPPPGRPAPLWRPDGWLAAELGAPGDTEAFERMLATLPRGAGVDEVAAEAQLWRLPVVPYRLPAPSRRTAGEGPTAAPAARGTPGAHAQITGLAGRVTAGDVPAVRDRPDVTAPTPTLGGRPGPLSGTRVLDATVMWAGPLATWLLAGLGAAVLTIEPAVRPDGTRAPHGGGIYPHGRLVPGDGHRSAVFTALARGKVRWDLDLREHAAVNALAHEIGHTDLLIDNLSPRARRQLGLTAAGLRPVNPDLLTVTIPAFGPGEPRRGWVAYGAHAHADSGLAWGDAPPPPARVPDAPPLPAAAAYADALTGLHVATVAVALLWGRRAGWRPDGDVEVPLMGSVRGLRARPGDADRLRADPRDLARALLERRADRFVPVRVAGEDFLHPRHPWSRQPGEAAANPADGPGPGVDWRERWLHGDSVCDRGRAEGRRPVGDRAVTEVLGRVDVVRTDRGEEWGASERAG